MYFTLLILREAVEHEVTTAARARSQSVDEGGGPSYGEVDLTPRDERRPGQSRAASSPDVDVGIRRYR